MSNVCWAAASQLKGAIKYCFFKTNFSHHLRTKNFYSSRSLQSLLKEFHSGIQKTPGYFPVASGRKRKTLALGTLGYSLEKSTFFFFSLLLGFQEANAGSSVSRTPHQLRFKSERLGDFKNPWSFKMCSGTACFA